jgi:hypothetical protein
MTTLANPIDMLTRFGPSINTARNGYRDAIRTLPPAIRSTIEVHLADRLKRAELRPMLGEYAPCMIADLFGVGDSAELRAISVGWQQLAWGILLLDDLIDEPSVFPDSNRLVAANLLVQRGVCHLLSVSRSPAVLRETIDSAFICNARAIATEQNDHRDAVTAFSRADILALGDKLGIIDICIDMIADLAPAHAGSRETVRHAFRQVVAGLQLLDDITDREDDLRSRNMTLPLTLAADFLGGSSTPDRSGAIETTELLETLIRSGALSTTLRAAADLLKSGAGTLMHVDPHRHSASSLYVSALLESIECVAREVDAASHDLARIDNDGIDPEARQRILDRMKRSLTVVAQSS